MKQKDKKELYMSPACDVIPVEVECMRDNTMEVVVRNYDGTRNRTINQMESTQGSSGLDAEEATGKRWSGGVTDWDAWE